MSTRPQDAVDAERQGLGRQRLSPSSCQSRPRALWRRIEAAAIVPCGGACIQPYAVANDSARHASRAGEAFEARHRTSRIPRAQPSKRRSSSTGRGARTRPGLRPFPRTTGRTTTPGTRSSAGCRSRRHETRPPGHDRVASRGTRGRTRREAGGDDRRLSGGRFELGVSVGAREQDFAALGSDWRPGSPLRAPTASHRRLVAAGNRARRRGRSSRPAAGPAPAPADSRRRLPAGRPMSERWSLATATSSATPASAAMHAKIPEIREIYSAAGRADLPIGGLAYYAVTDDSDELARAEANITHYYGTLRSPSTEMVLTRRRSGAARQGRRLSARPGWTSCTSSPCCQSSTSSTRWPVCSSDARSRPRRWIARPTGSFRRVQRLAGARGLQPRRPGQPAHIAAAGVTCNRSCGDPALPARASRAWHSATRTSRRVGSATSGSPN